MKKQSAQTFTQMNLWVPPVPCARRAPSRALWGVEAEFVRHAGDQSPFDRVDADSYRLLVPPEPRAQFLLLEMLVERSAESWPG